MGGHGSACPPPFVCALGVWFIQHFGLVHEDPDMRLMESGENVVERTRNITNHGRGVYHAFKNDAIPPRH